MSSLKPKTQRSSLPIYPPANTQNHPAKSFRSLRLRNAQHHRRSIKSATPIFWNQRQKNCRPRIDLSDLIRKNLKLLNSICYAHAQTCLILLCTDKGKDACWHLIQLLHRLWVRMNCGILQKRLFRHTRPRWNKSFVWAWDDRTGRTRSGRQRF